MSEPIDKNCCTCGTRVKGIYRVGESRRITIFDSRETMRIVGYYHQTGVQCAECFAKRFRFNEEVSDEGCDMSGDQ